MRLCLCYSSIRVHYNNTVPSEGHCFRSRAFSSLLFYISALFKADFPVLLCFHYILKNWRHYCVLKWCKMLNSLDLPVMVRSQVLVSFLASLYQTWQPHNDAKTVHQEMATAHNSSQNVKLLFSHLSVFTGQTNFTCFFADILITLGRTMPAVFPLLPVFVLS